MSQTEEWRAVPGFEGKYEVSDLGRVRSLDRIIDSPGSPRGYPRPIKGRLLKPQDHSGGYLQITLCGELHIVSWVVLSAFVGPRPSGLEACHNDGDKKNNTRSNLRWDTPVRNAADKVEHGTAPRGEQNGCAKLTVEDVLAIRKDRRDRFVVAAEYDIHPNHVNRLRARGRWAHV